MFNSFHELKAFLDQKVLQYNTPDFIESDPVSVPHTFSNKQDIEIAAFLAAILAWGQRKTIISKTKQLLQFMHYSPFDFLINAREKDLKIFERFKHRTFLPDDCIFFMTSLKNLYTELGSLEKAFFTNAIDNEDKGLLIDHFRNNFFKTPHLKRSEKHIGSPAGNSSAKRLNMFLRWMVRKDNKGVDFGLWSSINPNQLYIPLDIHSGRVARKMGLLKRNQNDWKSVIELTQNLRKLDPNDPVKYDFALFGMGIYEKI